MTRIIGIKYRVKETANGEARPTMVAIKTGDKIVKHELRNEDDELDFSRRRFPIAWRQVGESEDISGFDPYHCKWKKVKDDQDVSEVFEAHLRRVQTPKGEQVEICTSVPIAFEGLQEGDQVAMGLGAGNMLAGLLFIRGSRVGATVYRIPPMYLNEHRPDPDKDQDHVNLVCLLEQEVSREKKFFYEVRPADKALIEVAMKLDMRQEAQRTRIACGNRLIQSVVGKIFLDEETELVGLIKDRCEAMMVNDAVYQALVVEEEKREKDLKKAVYATKVWPIFEPIQGVGPRIAAGIIAPIGDIRRFMVPVEDAPAGPITEHEKFRWEQYLTNGPQNTFYGRMLIENGQASLSLEEYSMKVRCSKAYNKALNKGAAKLMKFCGVHCLPDGRFPRRRTGEVANWSPAARQALFLLADQFNRKPGSDWGRKLLQYKAVLREKHPEPIEVKSAANGKTNGDGKEKKTVKRYTNGHILKMAKWRTLTRFVRWLFKEWVKIEN